MAEMASETDPSSLMNAAFDDMDKTIDGILTDLGVAPEDPAFVHSDDYPIDDSALLHAAPYDAAKAHEYYLRNRQLKGRRHGGQVAPTGRPGGHGPAPAPNHKSAKQLRADAEARKAALRARLDRLHQILSDLVKRAKARSGIKAPATKKAAATPSSSRAKGHMTPKEKREARDRAEKYRKEHPKPADASAKQLHQEIADVQAKIKKARADLRASAQRARQHAQSHSKTASKGR
jgi:hypothetical protein